MGVQQALGDMDVIAVSDIEPGPLAVEEYRYPDARQLGDISKIDWNEVGPVDVICGGSPCFPAGALVLTDRGFTPIENIHVGDRVLTHLGRWKRVLATGSRVADTIILHGQGTDGIECTPNHPFLAAHRRQISTHRNGERYRETRFIEDGWIPAADMTGRMWLNMGESEPLPIPGFDFTGCQVRNIRLTRGLMYFLGRWLGDGWLNIHKRHERRNSIMKKVVVCDSFDKENELRERLAPSGLHFTITRERTGVRFCCSSAALYDWIKANFGEKAYGKRLPSWVYGLNREWRRALLDGYRDSDGHPTDHGWTANSVSRELILGMKALAASLGHSAGVFSVKKRREYGIIEGRVVNERPQWQLSVYDRSRKSVICERGYWGHVRSVESGRRNVRVYNLEVEDDNSYTVDGIAVHNCTDVSTAGKRAGMVDGTRSGLWSYQADAVRALKPRIIQWENVNGSLSGRAASRLTVHRRESWLSRLHAAGLCVCDWPEFDTDPAFKRPSVKAAVRERLDAAYLPWLLEHECDPATVRCASCGMPVYERTVDGWRAGDERLDGAPAPCMRALGRVLADLSRAGYDCVWRVLEAADVGAPHHRARVFVTGFRRDLFARMHPTGDPWASYDADLDVWTTGQADLFGDVDVFDGVWPKSGVMVDGCAYRLPDRMLALTSRPGVPPATPKTSDADHAGPNQRYGAGDSPLPAMVSGLDDGWVLPTPTASDGMAENMRSSRWTPGTRHALDLPRAIGMMRGVNPDGLTPLHTPRASRDASTSENERLLPTPNTMDALPPHADIKALRRSGMGRYANLRDEISLLPSPIARDGGGGGAMEPERKRAGRHAVTLQDVTEAGGLLPDGTIR